MEVTRNIKHVIESLKQGELAIFPTDTVWGIGLAAAYAPGPQTLYVAKQREVTKPIAWLVGGVDALDVYGTQVPDYARNLAHAFWPGALTLIVKASEEVPRIYQSQAATIALRMPAHASCLEIIQQVGPLVTSSANISGGTPPTAARAIDSVLAQHVACIFDDGSICSAEPSTVIDCTGATFQVLRHGSVQV